MSIVHLSYYPSDGLVKYNKTTPAYNIMKDASLKTNETWCNVQSHDLWSEAWPLKQDQWDRAQSNDETQIHDRAIRLYYVIKFRDYKGIDNGPSPMGYKRWLMPL
jgi:hypothetical protein